jgi:hypothetical protein
MKSKLLFVIVAVLVCQFVHAQNVSASSIEEVKVFPNPATTFLSVEVASGHDFTMTITNMLGSEVFHAKQDDASNITTFDISNFPNGYYLVRVSYHGKTLTKRILKK